VDTMHISFDRRGEDRILMGFWPKQTSKDIMQCSGVSRQNLGDNISSEYLSILGINTKQAFAIR